MKHQSAEREGKSKNTLKSFFVDGLIFLIPVVALLWLCSSAVGGIVTLVVNINQLSWIQTHGGILIIIPFLLIAVTLVVLLSGILVHFTILKRFEDWLEKKVSKLIPGFSILESMMQEKLLHSNNTNNKAVLVKMNNNYQLGILTEQSASEAVVYFPNSTFSGGGSIYIAPIENISFIDIPINELNDLFNKNGNGLLGYNRQLSTDLKKQLL